MIWNSWLFLDWNALSKLLFKKNENCLTVAPSLYDVDPLRKVSTYVTWKVPFVQTGLAPLHFSIPLFMRFSIYRTERDGQTFLHKLWQQFWATKNVKKNTFQLHCQSSLNVQSALSLYIPISIVHYPVIISNNEPKMALASITFSGFFQKSASKSPSVKSFYSKVRKWRRRTHFWSPNNWAREYWT